MDVGFLTLIFTGVTAVGAFVAALGSWAAAIATRKSSQGQILLRLLDDYRSKEMSANLKLLSEYRKQHADVIELAVKVRAMRGAVDDARRSVYWYYKNAWTLYASKMINKYVLGAIASTNGYELFMEVCVPIAAELDTGEDWEQYSDWIEQFRELFLPRTQA